MLNKLKSLVIVSMLVFIGACCYDDGFIDDDIRDPIDLNTEILAIEVIPEGDVYKIYRPEHLAWIVRETQYGNYFNGKTIRLLDDIDMDNKMFSGIPSFAGKLDGNHKKIHNLKIGYGIQVDCGLIRELEDGGSIENLTIESGRIYGSIGVGAFVGSVKGSSTITNVVNKADVSGSFFVGGIIGMSSHDDITITLDNSSNIGIVTGKNNGVGGLVGVNISTLTIRNSVNSGTIVGKNDYVGGLVGNTDLSLLIDNSSNIGDVTGVIEVGGLVGVSFTESLFLTITNSFNSGIIEGVKNVGGIVGNINGTAPTSVNITNVHSYATKIKGNDAVTGGIIGKVTSGVVEATNSYWLYDGTATAGTGGIDKAVGAGGTVDGTVLVGATSLNIAEFKDSTATAINFVDWDFTAVTGIWEFLTPNGLYPTLRNMPVVAP